MGRKRKKLSLTSSEITTVEKTINLDVVRLEPVRVIRWQDKAGKHLAIHLYSDNFPDLPSERLASLSEQSHRLIRSKLSLSIYWYNSYPNLAPLVESVSSVVRVFAIITKNGYSNMMDRVYNCCVFFIWLTDQKDITPPTSFSDITLEIILRFRDYLYHQHNKERLSKGLKNDGLWNKSIPGLMLFFMQRPSYDIVHQSISLSTFPKFYSGKGLCYSTVIPYSDLEAYQIIAAADKACSDYIHNWRVMREIEKMKIGSWESIEDICWAIINVERHSSSIGLTNKKSTPYQNLLKHFGMSYDQFYDLYSEAEILAFADKGSCPYEQFYLSSLDSLSDNARRSFAQAWVRRTLSDLFNARLLFLLGPGRVDWHNISELINIAYKKIKPNLPSPKFWEAAGLKPLNTFSLNEIASMFFPSIDAVYPFHLFVMTTSGANIHVVDSLDRNNLLSDLDPDNVVYRGVKKRTGKYNYRHEEIVVSRSEANGIHKRVEFVRDITAPLLEWCSSADFTKLFWLGIRLNRSRDRKVIQLDANTYDRCNRDFCSVYGLQQITYGEQGEIVDLHPMSYINSMRFRKTNVFKDIAENTPFQDIKASLADGSLETVLKYYINNDVQRQVNFKAIAALQMLLMEEMNAYSLETTFAGEIVYDTHLSEARDISNNLLTACNDLSRSDSEVQRQGCNCSARFGNFDVCLGCKSSRVFREHLPAICFRIIQYDQKKTAISNPDWDASYGLFRARAIDCLTKYASQRENYAHHVDAAWVIAKSEGGVYLPPLI